MQILIELTSSSRLRQVTKSMGGMILLAAILACGSGSPELRPGILTQPDKTKTHGRIVVKTYRTHYGPRTFSYDIIEIDGSPLRIPGGNVKRTGYCEVEGITAIDFIVRGDSPGIFVLQLNGDERIMERLCDYDLQGSWQGAVLIMPRCDTGWDAVKRERIKLVWDAEKRQWNIP